ncbi:MAG: PRC-barrel domain containing protein [Sphingomonadales bacterium]|nr:MAG: PRC-barrel domain containing protein [Sphingomonadales bacterium]
MSEAMSQTVTEKGHRLILGSRVEGTSVFNRDGESIGHIDDLSIERVSGKVVYAIMSFGGFLGIGERFHPIPWSLLNYNVERGGYVVPLDKAELKDAPHYDREELIELGGPSHQRFGERIYDYYGAYGPLPPYL